MIRAWAQSIKLDRWKSCDTLSLGNTNHLNQLICSILRIDRKVDKNRAFFQGFHFLYNNQQNLQLGVDGYDDYQAPKDENGKSLFKRRLWVKGNIVFAPQKIHSIDCLEKITSVRQIDQSTFVQISREFTSQNLPILTESRTLMYTNQLYQPAARSYPIETPSISTDIRLTAVDLLKYSMLTYNLHKIHYDLSYCQKVENLPNIILHGPFMISLLLSWFSHHFPQLTIKSFNYKNLQPCFINEDLKLSLIEKNDCYILSIVNHNQLEKYIEGTLDIYNN